MNSMQQIKIDKVTLNIGVGEPGDKLDKAMKLLNYLTGAKPVETKTMKRIPTLGLRPNLKIACKVTLRKEKANELLSNLLKSKDNTLKEKNFDETGNLSFGISEYIDIPEVEYNPEIGMFGFDVAVTLCRPGFRIKNRKINPKKIRRSKITKEESIEFMKQKFGVKVI